MNTDTDKTMTPTDVKKHLESTVEQLRGYLGADEAKLEVTILDKEAVEEEGEVKVEEENVKVKVKDGAKGWMYRIVSSDENFYTEGSRIIRKVELKCKEG